MATRVKGWKGRAESSLEEIPVRTEPAAPTTGEPIGPPRAVATAHAAVPLDFVPTTEAEMLRCLADPIWRAYIVGPAKHPQPA
jgi:hypothetical protein